MQVAFDSVQPTVNKLLMHQPINQDEEESLLRFFQGVAKDKQWLSSHQSESKNLLKAVTYFYITTDHPDSIAKIKAAVSDNQLLTPYMPEDITFNLRSAGNSATTSVLSLATQSPSFDTMFRSKYSEGQKVQEFNGTPILEINSISPKAAKAYLEWAKLKKMDPSTLSAQELHELCTYAESNETLQDLIPALEEGLTNNLSVARAVELIPFLDAVGGMNRLKEMARRKQFTLLNDKAAFMAFQTGKLEIKEFKDLTSEETKELCKDYLISRTVDFLNASKPESHVFLANFEALLPQIKNLSLPWLAGLVNKKDATWFLENMSKETTELNLANSPYEGDFYMVERLFPKLEVLDMSGMGETFYNLLAFKGLSQLKVLHIRDSKNLNSLQGVDKLANLEELDVRGINVPKSNIERYQRKGLRVLV